MDDPPSGFSPRFARLGVLRLPNFRNLFVAQTVSVIGDGITPIALTFAVLELTGSGTDLGHGLAASVWVLLVRDIWRLRPAAALAPIAPALPQA